MIFYTVYITNDNFTKISPERDVAQFGSASALGAGCRRFESYHPDLYPSSTLQRVLHFAGNLDKISNNRAFLHTVSIKAMRFFQ